MAETDIWAVVPIKETGEAKQRLAEFVPAHLRPGLALAMFEDVMTALAAAPGLAGIVVVTADNAAARIAKHYKARIFTEEARGGHTAVIAATAHRLAREECGGMLQVPGDIPLVTKDEVSRLLRLHQPAPAFTIVPSHDNLGSNAILVSPPDAVPLTFGDDSFFPHLKVAEQHGIEPLVVRMPGIGRDIDHAEDVHAFAGLRSATRTQTFLDDNGFKGMLR
jgi:2-phospho-L-lactate/phosphoenolpyruvate guanylyltransferase